MFTLIINLLLLPDPSSAQPLPFTYLEREARMTFDSIEECELERVRWYGHVNGVDIGDEAKELPEAEGSDRWTAVYAECVTLSPPIA